MKKLIFLFLAAWSLSAPAQQHEMLLPEMHTLTVEAGADGNTLPIITLGSDEQLLIGFDIMDTEYRRFSYHVEHLTYDFRPTTDLFESEYVRSAAEEEVIEDYDESMNTTVAYAHYSLLFPNDRMTPIVSGNYRMVISYENEDDELVPSAYVYFSVVEPVASLSVACTTNTDVDWNASHQQLSLELDMGDLPLRDESSEVKVAVMKNRRWETAALWPKPTHRNGQKLMWSHHRALLFPAGNEYRAFDMLSTRYPGMGMMSMKWDGDVYLGILTPDEPRRNYLVIDDRNGQYVSRTDDSPVAETESDYCQVDFELVADELADADVYIYGRWANFAREPERYRMTYDAEAGAYRASLFLKLGYYSYRYLTVPHTGYRLEAEDGIDGSFWQTENEYDVLVYYRRTGDRYWRLIAEASPTYKPR